MSLLQGLVWTSHTGYIDVQLMCASALTLLRVLEQIKLKLISLSMKASLYLLQCRHIPWKPLHLGLVSASTKIVYQFGSSLSSSLLNFRNSFIVFNELFAFYRENNAISVRVTLTQIMKILLKL